MSCTTKYSCGCVNPTCNCPPLPDLGSQWINVHFPERQCTVTDHHHTRVGSRVVFTLHAPNYSGRAEGSTCAADWANHWAPLSTAQAACAHPPVGSVWRRKDGLGEPRTVRRVVGSCVHWQGASPCGVGYESGSMSIKLWTQHLCPVQMPVTVTGRAASQPELQSLPTPGQWQPDAGSRWVHKMRDRHIEVVGVGKSTLCPRESWVKYTVVGSRRRGQIPLASFLDSYAPAPMSLGVVDFCGLEARVAALHCAKPAFDLHRLRAAQIFDVKPSEVTDAQRKVGKSANFLDTYR